MAIVARGDGAVGGPRHCTVSDFDLGDGTMPYYDFRCEGCGKKFTEKQSFEDFDRGKRIKCPKCGSTKVRQEIRPVFAKTTKKS